MRLLTNILVILSGSLCFNKERSLECFDKLCQMLSDPGTAEQALDYKQEGAGHSLFHHLYLSLFL